KKEEEEKKKHRARARNDREVETAPIPETIRLAHRVSIRNSNPNHNAIWRISSLSVGFDRWPSVRAAAPIDLRNRETSAFLRNRETSAFLRNRTG
ncbi:hypothetical protein PanWU01x14_250600, partial [Parasponia andersonii]